MIPMKTSTVFKNRWMALIWAAGIIWFAYDFAEAQPQSSNSNSIATDATGAAVTGEDENRIAQALGG